MNTRSQIPGVLTMIAAIVVFVVSYDYVMEHYADKPAPVESVMDKLNPSNNIIPETVENMAYDPQVSGICDKDCKQFVSAAIDKCGSVPLSIEGSSVVRVVMIAENNEKITKAIYNVAAKCVNNDLIRHEWVAYEPD